jgi:hypothetical protein
MIFVGWPDGDEQAEIDRGGAENIRKRFNPVGEKCEGMADKAGEALAQGEKKIRANADQGRVEPALHLLFGIGGRIHGPISRKAEVPSASLRSYYGPVGGFDLPMPQSRGKREKEVGNGSVLLKGLARSRQRGSGRKGRLKQAAEKIS